MSPAADEQAVAAIEARHFPAPHVIEHGGDAPTDHECFEWGCVCTGCGERADEPHGPDYCAANDGRWPCDVRVLLDRLADPAASRVVAAALGEREIDVERLRAIRDEVRSRLADEPKFYPSEVLAEFMVRVEYALATPPAADAGSPADKCGCGVARGDHDDDGLGQRGIERHPFRPRDAARGRGGAVMRGGWYCSNCGATTSMLPAGTVTCRRCGHLGLRGYSRTPRRVTCSEHPDWRGWNDGGINDDLGRHRRLDHAAVRP